MVVHGGDIYQNKVRLDFSVNVNPLGIPEAVREAMHQAAEDCSCYPDPASRRLRAGISRMTGVKEEMLLCGNGASELISAAVRAVNPGRTVLPVPSFYGYERALQTGSGKILFYPMRQEEEFVLREGILEELTETTDLLILANPNNPTGKRVPGELLEEILERCREKETAVLLDECFLGFCREGEKDSCLKRLEEFPKLMVLRAFTKLFAVPGLRLGYLACGDPELRRRIEEELPEWNVSLIAQRAGEAACSLMDYLAETGTLVETERNFLADGLKSPEIRVYPGDADFLLLQTGLPLYEKLLAQGILIRDCSNFKGLGRGYFRVAVKTRRENEQLLEAVKKITGEYEAGGHSAAESSAAESSAAENSAAGQKPEYVLPGDIEKRSFAMIEEELRSRGIVLPPEEAPVTRRVIHTTADFDYAKTLCYSKEAVEKARSLIRQGARIVTDTNMALSGINKACLAGYGGKAHCFMAEEAVAAEAKKRQVTRAAVSMEYASRLPGPVIVAVGNAPTALISLHNIMEKTGWRPDFIIGVPVGFVNVEAAKELILEGDVPYIVNRGRKGGSNVAAAICNALLYGMEKGR